jgi:hypothetical protein
MCVGTGHRGRPTGQQGEDLGDQPGAGGPALGMTLQQTRRSVQQEQGESAVRLGQAEPAFEGPAGGALLAERVPGNRLQQE